MQCIKAQKPKLAKKLWRMESADVNQGKPSFHWSGIVIAKYRNAVHPINEVGAKNQH